MTKRHSGRSRVATLTGLAVAGLGLAHFVKPDAFHGLTSQAFPHDTQRHLYLDGGIETALGLGLAMPKTRKLAIIGALGYGAYLAVNVARNR